MRRGLHWIALSAVVFAVMFAATATAGTSRAMAVCYHYCAWHNGVPCGRDHENWETYDVQTGQWWICQAIAHWTQWEDWDWFAE